MKKTFKEKYQDKVIEELQPEIQEPQIIEEEPEIREKEDFLEMKSINSDEIPLPDDREVVEEILENRDKH